MTKKTKSKEFARSTGRQFAALPLSDREGAPRVMLLTSRETHRWVLPKGWAEPDIEPHELAAKEAYEEAGLVGRTDPVSVGSYTYAKRLKGGRTVPCEVGVFLLQVERQLPEWPERGQRETRWFSLTEAAAAVQESELAALLHRLAVGLPDARLPGMTGEGDHVRATTPASLGLAGRS